jgi:TonB family protein
MILRYIALCLSSSALIAAPAQARDWGIVSGWYVTSGNQSCGIYSQQSSGSLSDVVILKRSDGSIVLQSENPDWNILFGTEARAKFKVDGRNYTGASAISPSVRKPGRGIIAAFSSEFERELRGGKLLAIVIDDRVVGQVSLSGLGDAMARVQTCLDDLRGGGKMPTAGFDSIASKAPQPIGEKSSWVSLDDYPENAFRERREGTVGFKLLIGRNGRVENCAVTQSSGHTDLDIATCRGITRRARFQPAFDANGSPVEGSYDSRVSWKVP